MKCLRFVSLFVALAVCAAVLAGPAQGAAKKKAKDDATKEAPAAETKADDKAKDAKPDDTGKKTKPRKPREGKELSTVTPSERHDGWWQTRMKAVNERAKQGKVDLLFIGDSITQGWEGAGKKVWEQSYGKRNAVNLGFGGDRTQHVLWRLDSGNIAGITPKLAVLMIGTNNSSQNSPEDIAAGVKAVVEKLRAKLPQTKVLVLGIFPRGPDDKDAKRQVNMKTNVIIAKLADDKDVYYMDIGQKFLDKDGKLTKEIMPDLLHLSGKGYTIWAEAIEPTVAKLMGEK